MTIQNEPDLGFLENDLFWNIKVKHILRVPYWCIWAAFSALFVFAAIMLFTTIAASASTIPVLGLLLDVLLSDIGSVIAIGVIAAVPGYCLYAFREDIDQFNKIIIDWLTPSADDKDKIEAAETERSGPEDHDVATQTVIKSTMHTVLPTEGLIMHSNASQTSQQQPSAQPMPRSRSRSRSPSL